MPARPPLPPAERCPDCGGLVERPDQPCLLCQARRLPRRHPPPRDDAPLELDLPRAALQRYLDVRAAIELIPHATGAERLDLVLGARRRGG